MTHDNTAYVKPTKTLLLTIALPDFYAEDWTQEAADEFYDGDLSEMVYDEMMMLSPTARVIIATGDKGGNDLHECRAVIRSATVRERQEADDQPEDERLTEMVEQERRANAR